MSKFKPSIKYMYSNYKRILTSFILCIFFANCTPKEFPLGKFQETPIIADGDATDWGLPLRFGSETESIQYAITNDKENIYVSVASNNQVTQMRMLRAGIKIYIDSKGKKRNDVYLSYPFKEDINNDRSPRNNNMASDPSLIKQKMIMDADLYSTTGFINMENKIYDVKDTSHVKIGMNFDIYNNLVFEAIIPLKNVLVNPIINKKSPSISIGVVVNNMMGSNRQMVGQGNRPEGGEGMGGGMRGGGMGGGGMRGGGMGGGGMRGGSMGGGGMRGGGMGGGGMRGGGMGGGGNYNSKPTINWYEFKLAYQAE